MPRNYYDTARALSEYLLFHYGLTPQLLPSAIVEPGALNFPARCVTECLDARRLPANARALDLGCAVGRSTFELARRCTEVVGLDYSKAFINVAEHLSRKGAFAFEYVEEGEFARRCRAIVPKGIDRSRIRFEVGDAMDLPRRLGTFDVVLMANLIDRLKHPRRCLSQLPRLMKPGGQLILTSPYTWLREYTPRRNWLGGFVRAGKRIKTFHTLKQILSPEFQLLRRRDLPFLIREHARKFQLGIAEASVWLHK
jgi:putative 4-mercaptohistidine N1-methyltranferase